MALQARSSLAAAAPQALPHGCAAPVILHARRATTTHAACPPLQQQCSTSYSSVGPWRCAGRRGSSRETQRLCCQAGKLDEAPLFADASLSGLGGPGRASNGVAGGKKKRGCDDVDLASEAGMDYTALRDLLKAGEWRKAEDETRALLIRLAGEDAVKRGWVYFTEVKTISVTDFQTIDGLWRAASNDKFGYSVQREVFNQCQRRWAKFFKQIDWTHGQNSNYRKWPQEFNYSTDAPKGHLPLTNALRGTQLFQAILDHPAWNNKASGAKSIDERAREGAKDTLKF